MTAATNEMLSQELDNCQQLFELEPENKCKISNLYNDMCDLIYH